MGKAMNKDQLNERIETVCKEFHGQGDDLFQVLGMMVAGEFFGWRVVRMVSTRRHWAMAHRLFGDPKLYMEERGPLASKSFGLKIADKGEEYWRIIRGQSGVPKEERAGIL